MTWVEMTGAVGAGKSTLRPHLIEAFRSTGLAATSLGEALDGSRSGRWPRVSRARAGVTFGGLHPDLVVSVSRAMLAAPLPLWHKRAIMSLMANLAALDRVTRSSAAGDVVVVDEGWIHRAVNLFAWTPTRSFRHVDDYLERIPLPDIVVVVEASSELRQERLAARGLPKRLRDKEPLVVDRFLARSASIVAHSAEWLGYRGVPLIRVSNETSLAAAERALAVGIEELVRGLPTLGRRGPQPSHAAMTPVVSIRRPFPLRRPDRLSIPSRPNARHGRDARSDRIRDVLSEYGLAGRSSRLLDDSGRSTSLLVDTPGGGAVLKRYKPSITAKTILHEHAVLLELARMGFPAPRLIPTRSGSTLVELDDAKYALTELLSGYVRWDRSLLPRRESSRLRADAGVSLAMLHQILIGIEPPGSHQARVAPGGGEAAHDVAWHRDAISRIAATDPPPDARPEWQMLWTRATEIDEELTRLAEELVDLDLPQTVIHGDYGPYNLLIRSGAPLVVMDFELARRDWRLIDLVRAIPRFATNRLRFSPSRARRFLDGYDRSGSLLAEEVSAMPSLAAFLDLRRAVVLWSAYAGSQDATSIQRAAMHLRRADKMTSGSHTFIRFVRAYSTEVNR